MKLLRSKILLLFALIIILLLMSFANIYAQKKQIVLIVADDLGVNDLGIYGSDFIETPFIDSLVKSNAFLKCSKAYSSGPICSPTRASIISGLSPARHGMTEHLRGVPPVPTTQRLSPPFNATSLSQSLPTVASLARQSQCKTALIGKWHLGGNNQRPALYGYDFTYGGGSPGLPNSFFYPFFSAGTFPELDADSKPGDYLDDVLADRAVRYITDHKDSSFFLHINFYSPHVPITAKDHLIKKYTAKRDQTPTQLLPSIHYAAMVEGLDQNIAKVIRALKNIGDLKDMLIIITSDHGGLSVREVQQYAAHTPATDNGVLRAGKGYLYEGGIRIPLMINRGIRSIVDTSIINTTDFYSTVADFLGSPHRSIDGSSIFSNAQSRLQFWHFPHYSPQGSSPHSAILDYPYKLIYHWEKQYVELFDLSTDPSESLNLSYILPQKSKQLTSTLLHYLDTIKAKIPIPNPDYKSHLTATYDSFDYEDVDLSKCNGGRSWFSQYDRAYGEAKIKNKQVVFQKNASYLRQFLNPIDLKGQRTFWFSFDYGYENSNAGTTEISLKTSEDQDIKFKIKATTSQMSVKVGNLEKTISLPKQTNTFIVRLSMTTGLDSIHLWLNHTSTLPPTTPFSSLAMQAHLPDALAEYIQLDHLNTSDGASFLDNLACGIRWHDIRPSVQIFTSAYEPFDYSPFTTLESQGYNDCGWLTHWYRSGAFSPINEATIQNNSIQFPSLTPSGHSTRFEYKSANTQIRLNRDLLSPIISNGKTYWLSFLINIDPSSQINNIANLALVSKDITDNGGMRLAIGRSFGTGRLSIISPPNGAKKDSPISDFGTHHILAAIVTNDTDAPDSVFLFIDKPVGIIPSFDQADAIFQTSFLNVPINSIRLRAEGSGTNQTPLIASFDEITIADVFPFSHLISPTTELTHDLPTVYPNPFTNDFHIQFDFTIDSYIQVVVIDNRSQIVYSKNYEILGQTISITPDESLPSGYYFVQLIDLKSKQFISKPIALIKIK